jgi:hypothetical protein
MGLLRLINDVGIKDFRLENALPQDYDNLKKAIDNKAIQPITYSAG